MTEVLFYHLTESTLEEALPPLLEKSLQRGWRVVVQLGTEERRDALDNHLWTYRDDSFLAHGTEHDNYADKQPILLMTGSGNTNNAQIRFMADGAAPPDLSSYQRAVFMFDGHDMAQVELARTHWKAMRANGYDATYWQQASDKRWEKKA